MKTQTRKEFIKTCCLIMASGLGLPILFNSKGSKEVKKSDMAIPTGLEEGKMIAFCGITCSECPAYIATQKDDDKMRAETAKKWSEQFKSTIKPGDINCDGCISNSERLFNYCKVCEIRKCGKEKDVKNCGYCKEYPCTKLTEFFKMVPEAKKTLDEIRKNIKG